MGADLRLTAALAAGKLTAAACRWLRRGGGTVYPGRVATRLDPRILGKLVHPPEGTVLVTGTNGKTTTTGMITHVLEQAGRRVLSNAAGSNIMDGLVAAAVAEAGLGGHTAADAAVLEVDELWLEQAVRILRPRLVVVLNFLRDQLDRSGELETTASRVGQAVRQLPADAMIVANADDPLVWTQVEGLPGVIPIGVQADDHLLPSLPHSADARACPRCESPLEFERVVLAHCGSYRCPRGDFARPQLAASVTRLEAPGIDRLELTITSAGASGEAEATAVGIAIGGIYNTYNTLAALTACRALGLSPEAIRSGLRSFAPRFGRQETLILHDRQMRMMLAKNPAGFDEVLRTADELGEVGTYLIAINDGIADGRDVSWLWDVDFERLAQSRRQPSVVASGRRAQDLAVRLKYAGLPAERVILEAEPALALERLAALAQPDEMPLIVPTYTAMLELRAVAERAGAVLPFWHRQRPAVPAR